MTATFHSDRNFREKWQKCVERKQSVLCVGIDAAEPDQRGSKAIPEGVSKVDWTLDIIDKVAPYAAAIKINRNYYKDLSRAEMQKITVRARLHGMVTIDDTKLADIGDTNEAAMYHAAAEGYDALTYAPFPGNALQAAQQAAAHKIGLIMLVLMSNPEYGTMKNAQIDGVPLYRYLAQQAVQGGIDGVVIGAPSPSNHIRTEELDELAALLTDAVILVPGVGAQGGEIGPILQRFGRRTLVNVGRTIIYADDPAAEAKRVRDALQAELAQF